jgi:Mg-chelatase subunit ChlD
VSWVRKTFDGAGLTQYPPGPHLDAVAAHYSGTALLCIDVSLSMEGRPLTEARRGGRAFLDEARAAGYRVGLVLWNARVVSAVDPPASRVLTAAALHGARAGGGTDLQDTLRYAIATLTPLPGDRVVCVFGDGDVGNWSAVSALAAQARAHGIRIVVRGLGEQATSSLSSALTPDERGADQLVSDVGRLSDGIASMARGLRGPRS